MATCDCPDTWERNILFSKAGPVSFISLKDYNPTATTDTAPGDTLVADPGVVVTAEGVVSYRPASPGAERKLPSLPREAPGQRP